MYVYLKKNNIVVNNSQTNNMSEIGWIKLFRKIQDNELYFEERFTRMQAWIDLLILASIKSKTKIIRGIEIILEPGQLFWSQEALAKRWQWNRRTIAKFFTYLEKQGQITRKVHDRITVTSINNWSKYQEDVRDKVHDRVHANKEAKKLRRITTEKSVVEDKKNKKESRNNSPTLIGDLLKNKKIIVSEDGPKTEEWQNLAVNWSQKLKLNEEDSKVLFKLFKNSKSNSFGIERLCSLALEANAFNPIGYILAIKKQEKDKKITVKA